MLNKIFKFKFFSSKGDVRNIRVVDLEGKLSHNIVGYEQALKSIDSHLFDLLPVDTKVDPPIYRVFSKKSVLDRSRSIISSLRLSRRISRARDEGKEFNISTSITTHDLNTKLTHIKDLLLRGNRIKFCIKSKNDSKASFEDISLLIDQFLSSNFDIDAIESIDQKQIRGSTLTYSILLNKP